MAQPKIQIISDEPDDVTWAAWGAKKLDALKKVVTGSFKRYFAVDPDVTVEIKHIADNEHADSVRVRRTAYEHWYSAIHYLDEPRTAYALAGKGGSVTFSRPLTTTPTPTGTVGTVEGYVNGVLVGTVPYSTVNTGGTMSDPSTPVRSVTNTPNQQATSVCGNYGSGTLCTAARPAEMSPMALYSSNPSYVWIGTGDPGSGEGVWTLTSFNDSWSDPFGAAYFAAQGAQDAANKIRVFTSDGVELASEPYETWPNSTPKTIPAPGMTAYAGTPGVSIMWAGNASWDVYRLPGDSGVNDAGVSYSNPSYGAKFDHTISFTPPDDVIGPTDGAAPYHPVPLVFTGIHPGVYHPIVVASGGTFYAATSQGVHTDYPLGTYTGTDPYVSDAYIAAWGSLAAASYCNNPDVADWGSKWVTGLRTSRVRERAWRKKKSDALKASLAAGQLGELRGLLGTAHARSSGTFMAAPMTITVQTSANTAVPPEEARTKTVTMTYQYVDGEGQTRTDTQTVVGSYTEVRTLCTTLAGTTKYYYTASWSSWMETTATGVTVDTDLVFRSHYGGGLLQMRNGSVISGASNVTETYDNTGQTFTPPYPYSSTSLSYTYPDIYRRYRERISRMYTKNALNVTALDSLFEDGEVVDVIPLSVRHATHGDLGVFPAELDLVDMSKLKFAADTRYSFRYKYSDGSWTFMGAKSLQLPEGQTYVELPYEFTEDNIVFVSRKPAWPDVKDTYKAQMVALKDTENPPTGIEAVYAQLKAVL